MKSKYCYDERTLGNNLLGKRREQRLTQDFVAKKLGIARSTLSQIENGRNPITIIQLCKFADLFNCSTDELLSAE